MATPLALPVGHDSVGQGALGRVRARPTSGAENTSPESTSSAWHEGDRFVAVPSLETPHRIASSVPP